LRKLTTKEIVFLTLLLFILRKLTTKEMAS